MADMISPQHAFQMLQNEGAVFVDTREPDEYARLRIAGARLMPLSVLACLPPDDDKSRPVIYFCHSGRRTKAGESVLDARGHKGTYILEGGILGWQSAGLPLVAEKLPLPIMRQVHVAAGGLVLLFVLLGMLAPPLLWLAALVGAGLMFSGISGFCGMAIFLQKMPWNKRRSNCKSAGGSGARL